MEVPADLLPYVRESHDPPEQLRDAHELNRLLQYVQRREQLVDRAVVRGQEL